MNDTALLEPIPQRTSRRTNLHEDLVRQLRQFIVEGRLKPGERIQEAVLCEELGVSRTPIREALKVLASELLVELLPNRGARVALLSNDDVRELFEVISVLEGLAGELAAKRITERELDEIIRLHTSMVEAYEANDRSGYFELNQAIHRAIIDASGNAALKRTHEAASGRLLALRFKANQSNSRWREAVHEHEVMIKLLELRHADQLGLLLRTHVMNKLKTLDTLALEG